LSSSASGPTNSSRPLGDTCQLKRSRHSRGSGNPYGARKSAFPLATHVLWIPAYAGMTLSGTGRWARALLLRTVPGLKKSGAARLMIAPFGNLDPARSEFRVGRSFRFRGRGGLLVTRGSFHGSFYRSAGIASFPIIRTLSYSVHAIPLRGRRPIIHHCGDPVSTTSFRHIP
jgi:hypothetical protein